MKSKEKKGFTAWLNRLHRQDDKESLQSLYHLTDSYKSGFHPDVDRALQRFQHNLEPGHVRSIHKRKSRSWQVAAVIALLVAAGFAIKSFLSTPESTFQTVSADQEDQTELILNDGTYAFLNTASTLRFPDKFTDDKRLVEMSGEVFFDVVRDPERPFLITTDQIVIEVLGTSFNVRSYPNEDFVEVFVKSGKVAVTIKSENKRYTLLTGEKLTLPLNDKSAVQVEMDPSENAIAWKSGVLSFQKQRMEAIFSGMERLYDVKIEAANPALLDCLYTINLEAGKLQEAFGSLEAACQLDIIATSDSTYLVQGKCCE